MLRFESIAEQDNGEPLVDLAGYPFLLDPVYHRDGWATDPTMYLRRGVADRLAEVQDSWQGRYRLRILDGYRPRAVQQAIYGWYESQLRQDNPQWTEARLTDEAQRFVTRADDPHRIPPHATGGAVDLTLAGADGRDLDMGTAFDHFGPRSRPGYFEAPGQDPAVRDNRRLLLGALAGAGFVVDDCEWWHFDLGNQSWALRTGAASAHYGETPNPARLATASAMPSVVSSTVSGMLFGAVS